MTDLVAQLVGALEGMADLYDTDEGCKSLPQYIAARAALSEAKAGGWVAVPVEPTPEMVKTGLTALFDRKLPPAPWEDCIAETYAAMLAARPLPNPPKGEV